MSAIKNNQYTSIPDWFSKPGDGSQWMVSVPGGAGSGSYGGGGGGFSGGGGSSIKVLKTTDLDAPTDYNVLSALRSYQDLLRKDKEDSTQFLLSLLGGLLVNRIESGDLTEGILGTGFLLQTDHRAEPGAHNGRSYLEVDELFVRVKALFTELEIRKLSHTGGSIVLGPGGGKCTRVEEYDTYYRCYLKTEEDGVEVDNTFYEYDQVQCRQFNIKEGTTQNASNKYYWRLCVGVGDDYIDLSKDERDLISDDAPEAGDDMVTVGNQQYPERQSVIILSTVESKSPSITLYAGINSFTTLDKEVIEMGVNSQTYKAFINVFGDAYIGMRDGSSYMRFNTTDGLMVQGKISTSSQYGDTGNTLAQQFTQIENSFREDLTRFGSSVINSLTDLQNQIDGKIDTWFYDPVPTLNNLPASGWITVEELNSHIGDLYYAANGNAYRFVMTNDTYEWIVIDDSDVITALSMAKQAQDTADSKRQVFVVQPQDIDSYDVGDLWVDAIYGTTYKHDVLRANTKKLSGDPFSIDHWQLAAEYTDDTVANEAINIALESSKAAEGAADDAKSAALAVKTAALEMQVYTNKCFWARLITTEEREGLTVYINNITHLKTNLANTYNELYNNALLSDATSAKTDLYTYYTQYVNTIDELLTRVQSAFVNNIVEEDESAIVDLSYRALFEKCTEYSGYVNKANNSIQIALNSKIDGYQYLQEAFNLALQGDTIVEGGLIQTTMSVFGYRDQSNTFIIKAGTNGGYVNDKTIASWWGGSMIDRQDYPEGETVPSNAANALIRMDGTGYFSKGNFWWDDTGKLYADPMSFVVGPDEVRNLLRAFYVYQPVDGNNDLLYIIPRYPFGELAVSNTNGIQIGVINELDYPDLDRIYIGYDSDNHAVYVYAVDKDGWKKPVNFYATGEITAYGPTEDLEDANSGGIIENVYYYSHLTDGTTFDSLANDTFNAYAIKEIYDIAAAALTSVALSELTDVNITTSTLTPGQVLTYRNGKWENASVSLPTNNYLMLSGGTMEGSITINALTNSYGLFTTTNNSGSIGTSSAYFNQAYITNIYGTLNGTLNGSATSAAQLTTARTLWGQSFNGTAAISGSMSSVGTIGFNTASLEIGFSQSRLCIGSTGQAVAMGLNAGSLLVSNAWADYTKVPTNGIYSKGNILSSGELTAYSDIRLKTNIEPLLNRGYVKPVTYIKDGKQSVGFIAQDVQKLYPELVIEGTDENKYLSLNYAQYTAVLQSQIIEIDDEVTTLKKKVKNLECEIKRLKG